MTRSARNGDNTIIAISDKERINKEEKGRSLQLSSVTMNFSTLLAILVLVTPFASATIGLDAIDAISTSTFTCLKNAGYSFYVSRAWRSIGASDPTGIQNIKNAWAGGMSHVDAYIFPCTKTSCATAANQVEAALNKLKSDGAKIGQFWLDVEVNAWPSDKTHNRQFITDMANKAESMGYKVGIYTNNNNWEQIVGLDWTGMSKYPLWWARYNGKQDLTTGFTAFGGWSKPNIHQYSGDVKGACSVTMDQNYYP